MHWLHSCVALVTLYMLRSKRLLLRVNMPVLLEIEGRWFVEFIQRRLLWCYIIVDALLFSVSNYLLL